MKRVTAKMLVTLIGTLVAAPFFVFALILGARAVSVSQGAQDDLLLAVLALAGAGASIVNGIGSRTESASGVAQVRREPKERGLRHGVSATHLGY